MSSEKEDIPVIRIGDRLRVSRRGKKRTFVASYWHAGAHRRKSLQTANRRVAIRRATRLAAQLEQDDFTRKPRRIGLCEALDEYLDMLKALERAPRTIVRYAGVLRSLREFLASRGVVRLDQITRDVFDQFLRERRRDHAAITVAYEAVVVKQWMRWATDRELVAPNPLAAYRLPKVQRQRRPAPRLDQLPVILQHCSPSTAPLVTVLAASGLRSGELQALEKRDVDLAGGFIHVTRQLGGPTKTHEARKVPIHPAIRPIVARQLKADGHALLFTNQPSERYPCGGHHISTKKLNTRFKDAVRRAGFDGFVVHSLRHCFITACLDAGIPGEVVRVWVGHRDRSTTAGYFHLTDGASRQWMSKISFVFH